MKTRKVYIISLANAPVVVCRNQSSAYRWLSASIPVALRSRLQSYSQFNRLINGAGFVRIVLDGVSAYQVQVFNVL